MTALLRARGSTREMACLFDATVEPGLSWKETIWPGEHVPVALSEAGERRLTTLRWGLPAANFQRPTPHAQRGTLFGRDLIQDASRLGNVTALRRCLIILESFAYPASIPGARTRGWIGLWDRPLAAWAGYCAADRTGCAGMVVRANQRVADLSETMPRLLQPEDHQAWLEGASLLSIGPAFDPADFYREDLGERWSRGEQDSVTLPLFAA